MNDKKLKKRVRHYRKIIKVGVATIAERDNKIAQLTSILEAESPKEPPKKAHPDGSHRQQAN